MKQERPEVGAQSSVFREYLERLPADERLAIQRAERNYLDSCATSELDQLALSFLDSMEGYRERPAGPHRAGLRRINRFDLDGRPIY